MTRLLIAGGGTGGHLFPGVAVAEALRARDPDAEVLFVGTARGIEARVLEPAGWSLATIDVSGLKTVGLLGALAGLVRIPRALWQSRRIVKRFAPDAVLGVGGYASGPAVLAAWWLRKPTSILNQDSIPGLTNKILGRFVRTVFVSFDEARQFFKPKKIQMTGTPIRAAIRDRLLASDAARGRGDEPFSVFVFGGSQGAVAVNTIVLDALAMLGRPMRVVHQTGHRDFDRVRAAYADADLPNIDVDCRAFIDDMATEYHRADLVIARAGAVTIAELAIAHVPALLIPLPSSADNHQEINATELVERGAALMFRQSELDGARLSEQLHRLMDEPEALERMRNSMAALGRPHAADDIVDWIRSHV